jgi:hypothetical protein
MGDPFYGARPPSARRTPRTGPNRAATSCAATSCAATTGAGAPSRSSVPSPKAPSPPTRTHRPSGTARARPRRGEPRSTSHACVPPSSHQMYPPGHAPRAGPRDLREVAADARRRDARRRSRVRRLGDGARGHRPGHPEATSSPTGSNGPTRRGQVAGPQDRGSESNEARRRAGIALRIKDCRRWSLPKLAFGEPPP